MSLPITSILAGFLALLLVVLSNRVISARYKTPDSDEDKKKLEETVERRIRGQANLVEYGPMALILFALLEMQAVNMLFLTVMAVLFAFARAVHGYAFGFTDHWKFGRLYGTMITFIVIAVLAGVAVVVGLLEGFA